jgi:hypothetical protein
LLRIWYCGLVISIPHAGDQRGGRWSFQEAALEYPRTIRQGMDRLNLTSIDGEPECSRTDAEHASRFVQIHPSFRFASLSIVTRDVMVGAERDHSFSRPAITTPREEPIPIQDVRQQIIRTDLRQHAHRFDDVLRRVRTTLTPPSSPQSQLRMDAAFPMDDQNDFAGVGIDINDDFVNECSDDAFL